VALPAWALALGAALGGAPTARAATLYSPPAQAFDLGGTQYCQMRNIGPTAMQVTIDNLDFSDDVVESTTANLAPGHSASSGVDQGLGTSCRFTVAGSAKKVRAVAVYFDGTKFTAALPAR
jgi:hypothetical protein